LAWESEFDAIKKFREWILIAGIAALAELEQIEEEAKESVRLARDEAWADFKKFIHSDIDSALAMLRILADQSIHKKKFNFAFKNYTKFQTQSGMKL
jgi:2-oxoisovalerate dehydrogenase E1 component